MDIPATINIGSGQAAMEDAVNVELFISDQERSMFVTRANKAGFMIKADACILPIKSETFSRVVMFHSLEHFVHPYFALKEAYRVLIKNGLIELDMPNASRVTSEHPTHLYSWTQDTIKHLLTLVGFSVISSKIVDNINMKVMAKKC